VEEALKIVRDLGGVPVAVTVIVDRSGCAPDFGTSFLSLAALTFPTFKADELPPELASVPITKPGS
jgi:orotate phosphoribosyltransferase